MTSVRQLCQKDYRSIKQIYSGAFSLYDHPICDLYDSWRFRSEENSYGIFLESNLVGFAICSFHRRTCANMYLDYIAIDEAFRGQGYGSILLKVLIDKCQKEHRSIYLFPDSFKVAAWYKTFGFYETLDRDPIKGKPPYYLNWHGYSRR